MSRVKVIHWIRAAALCLLVIFSFGASGEICGVFFEGTDSVFGNKFPDNRPKDIRKVMARIRGIEATTSEPVNSGKTPVAVLVVKGNPRAVVGINLETGKQLWRVDAAVNSDVTLGGNLVFFKSGNDVVAYKISNGVKLWDYPLDEGWDYFGADASGPLAALSVGVGGIEPGGYANAKLVAVDAGNGIKLWERGVGSGLLGNPVVMGELIFVPWDRQKVVVVDADDEEEICRVRAADYPINFLRKGAGGVFAGSSASKAMMGSLYRFNESSANGRREGVTVFMPTLEPVPGIAHFGRDTFTRPQGGRSTEEKIRFHWSPASTKETDLALEGDQFYLHYWRYIIAFDAKTSTVNWAYISPVILESVAALGGGNVIAADTTGRLILIDGKTGKESWSLNIGQEVLSAVFDADGFAPKSAAGKADTPEASLLKLILDNDNRMLPIRTYATDLLAQIPKPQITADLLSIYADANTPDLLKKAVVRAVEKRTIGAEHMIQALDMKYDYLAQTEPPPMKVVAPALINMNATEAVPKLLEHLLNHETPTDSLPYILAAIYKLGDASVAEPIKKFLTLYHADSSFIKHEQVLASAAHTLMKFGDKSSSEAFIAAIRDDNQTLLDLKILLRSVLDPKKAAQEAAAKRAAEEAERLAKAKAERLEAEAKNLPDTLSSEQIQKTIVDQQDLLRPCIVDALKRAPDLKSIRMRFVLSGQTGTATELKVLPNDIANLKECLDNAFELIQFRRFKTSRQTSTYTIRIEPKQEETKKSMDMGLDEAL